MKTKFLLLLLVVASGCNAQEIPQQIEINYEAYTRGSSIDLNVTSKGIVYTAKGTKTKQVVTKSHWNSIKDLINSIDVENLESFKAPSDNRTRDAALHATVKIKIGDKVYSSQTFDHGNPPKELKPLIESLFKIVGVE